MTAELDTNTSPPAFILVDGRRCTPSEALKKIRTERGWNTKQLGEEIGASARTVEDWEQERYTPRKPTLKLICTLL